MQIVSNFVSSKGGVAGILAGVVWLDTMFAPVLPSAWQNVITAILALIAFYYHGSVVGAARANRIKGI